MLRVPALVCFILMSVLPDASNAQDIQIDLPPGLAFPSGGALASGVDILALAVRDTGTGDHAVGVLDLGQSQSTLSLIAMSGAITGLEVSNAGDRVLVRHDDGVGNQLWTLLEIALDGSLALAWTVPDVRDRSFSTTGATILAQRELPGEPAELELDVLGLDGQSIRMITSQLTEDALLVGTGEQVLLATKKSVLAFSVASAPTVEWRHGVGRHEAELKALRLLGDGSVHFVMSDDRWDVTSTDGQRLLSHSEGSFRVSFPTQSWPDFAAARPYASTPFGQLVLHADGGNVSLLYDPSTGESQTVSVDPSAPQGTTLASGLHASHLVFRSAGSLVLRPVL